MFFLAEHLCLLKGDEPISLPIIPETHTLFHFNVMFAHLFNVLPKSQAMSLYEINQVKTLTIEALVNSSFPAIKATDDVALPFVGPRTVAYGHALSTPSQCFKSSLQTPKHFEMSAWFAKNWEK